MVRMCFLNVNFLSNIKLRTLKKSDEFRVVLFMKRSGRGRKYCSRSTNNHNLSLISVQPHAPQVTPCTILT